MSSTVEQIKSRLGIEAVVGTYIKLEKAGVNFKARCPFHNEKTPSFFVSPSRDSYYCFGCARGGDIFTFVQELEGVQFKDALRILADRAGVSVMETFEHGDDERMRYRAILRDAVLFYRERLTSNQGALMYLNTRGVDSEAIERFGIGYAPAEWRSLYDSLVKKHKPEDLVRVGVSATSKGRTYDRFRNRIMFPINDTHGHPIAFSGRMFGDEASDENRRIGQVPGKYINSPDSPIYDKSRALFGFDLAKTSIRQLGTAVFVEGQFDVVLSHKVGITNAVAVSGTALTESHIELVARFANTIITAFDGDDAGIRASKRAIELMLARGIDSRAVRLPQGSDPADLARKDPNEWHRIVRNAEHIIDYFLGLLIDEGGDRHRQAVKATESILPFVALLEKATERAHFIGRISTALGLPEEPLWKDCEQIMRTAKDSSARATSAQRSSETLNSREKTRMEILLRRLLGIFWWTKDEGLAGIAETIVGSATWHAAMSKCIDEREALLFEAEMYFGKSPPNVEIEQLLEHLRHEVIKQELNAAVRSLRQIESSGDPQAVREAVSRCNDLNQKLAHSTLRDNELM